MKCSPFALLPPCWCLSQHMPSTELISTSTSKSISLQVTAKSFELCPSHQAAAVDKEDDWSWADNPQWRRGDNMGLILACERKRRVVQDSQDSCRHHIFRAAAPAVHFKTNTSRMKGAYIFIRYGQTAPSWQHVPCLLSCSIPPVTQSISRFPQRTQRGLLPFCQCGSSFPSLCFLHWYLSMLHFSPFHFPPFLPVTWFYLPLW